MITDEQRAEIVDRRRMGRSIRRISDELGLSYFEVRRVAREMLAGHLGDGVVSDGDELVTVAVRRGLSRVARIVRNRAIAERG